MKPLLRRAIVGLHELEFWTLRNYLKCWPYLLTQYSKDLILFYRFYNIDHRLWSEMNKWTLNLWSFEEWSEKNSDPFELSVWMEALKLAAAVEMHKILSHHITSLNQLSFSSSSPFLEIEKKQSELFNQNNDWSLIFRAHVFLIESIFSCPATFKLDPLKISFDWRSFVSTDDLGKYFFINSIWAHGACFA